MAHAPTDIVQWAIARGTRVYNLTVTGDDVDERGLKAETHIQDGDLLIAAPLACALTSTDALKRFGTLWKRFAKKTEVHTLAIELMHKVLTDPESVWVKALPARVGNWPQWTEEERQFLSGNARVKQLLVQQQQEFDAAAKDLLSPVQQSPDFGAAFSSELFRWAVAIVLSRSFEVTIGGEKRLAIIPLVDYLNHKPFSSHTSSVSFDEEAGEFRVSAREHTPAGGQVLITYGAKSNADLLVCYGFVLPDANPYNAVCIKVGEEKRGKSERGDREALQHAIARGVRLSSMP
jgi:hypothetical protein